MPRSPGCTTAVAVNPPSPDDDEDNDICPVCDGDCTCNNRSHPSLPPTVNHASARSATTPTALTASSVHPPRAQPLKIKLTVPPNIQNRARCVGSSSKKSRVQGSPAASNGGAGAAPTSCRPTNISSTTGHGQNSLSDAGRTKRRGRAPKIGAVARGGTTIAAPDRQIYNETPLPKVEISKLKSSASRQSTKSRAKGTITKKLVPLQKKQNFLAGFSSELQLEDDIPSGRYPTFVSAEGLTSEASDSSDSDFDSDTSGFGSDSSLAEEEENYIVAEQRRHDKARIRRELLGDDVPRHKDSNNSWVIPPRKRSVGLSDVDMKGDTDEITEEDEDEDDEMEEEEEEDETDGRTPTAYTGIATGWSSDEESCFDANLFFANLTDADTSSDDSCSDTDDSHQDSAAEPLSSSVTSKRSDDLEVIEAWDGQVVFTNGSSDGQGILDLAFEANAAQLIASDGASIAHESDIDMQTDSDVEAGDGDSTEDEDGLHAMKLFQWPSDVSSINPMSTVSPDISPAPFSERSRQDSTEGSAGESPRPITRGGIPIMGQFSLEGSEPQRTAVLNGGNKDVPSPYHRRRRFSSSAGSFSSMDLRGRYPTLSSLDERSSETPRDVGLDEPIKLDDVLDSTFLDSEPEMQTQNIRDSGDEQRLAQSLSRWDRVPVGSFRLTRESASDVPTSPGWASKPCKFSVPDAHSYGNALKSSPLHTMLWHDKSIAKANSRKSKGVTISPVLLPVYDGDRTPTHVPYHYDLHSNYHQQQHPPFKNQKESRREMKMMKRKSHAPSNKHHDHHQRHHRRNHHPNMKSRGNASVQRTFFSSPTSAPSLNV